MNVRNPTREEELTMLYGARYAVSERMKNGSVQYAKRLNYDEWHFVDWQDIFDYLTKLIDERR